MILDCKTLLTPQRGGEGGTVWLDRSSAQILEEEDGYLHFLNKMFADRDLTVYVLYIPSVLENRIQY